jgi:hypothetical protein
VRSRLWESTLGFVGLVSLLGAVAVGALAYLVATSGDSDPGVVAGPLPTPVDYEPAVPDLVGGDVLWADRAVLDSDGLELDGTGPRRATAGDLFTESWSDISARPAAKIALWVETGIPTAAQCRDTVILFGRDHALAETGRRYCVTTSDGRPALIKLVRKTAVGPYGWMIQASVWSHA